MKVLLCGSSEPLPVPEHRVGLCLQRDSLSESLQAAGWLQPPPACCAWGVRRGGGSSEHTKAPVASDLRWKREFSSLASVLLASAGLSSWGFIPSGPASFLAAVFPCARSPEILVSHLHHFEVKVPRQLAFH